MRTGRGPKTTDEIDDVAATDGEDEVADPLTL
jgi:hypothetical protein